MPCTCCLLSFCPISNMHGPSLPWHPLAPPQSCDQITHMSLLKLSLCLTHILNHVPILFQSALYFTFETFRHYLLECSQTHVYWAGDAIQPSHPLSSPSPPTFNLSQHQDLFQWVISLHQVAKSLELQLQHQSFQWIFRADFLWDWLVWSPCIQGTLSSLLQHHIGEHQSSALSSPLSSPFTSVHDYWKNHSLTIQVLNWRNLWFWH